VIGAIDLGGTQVRVAIADSSGRLIRSARVRTADLGGPSGFVRWCTTQLNRIGGKDMIAVGVSAPGPLDSKLGVLINPPNLMGWKPGLKLAAMLERSLGVPIYLENDANLAALAELRQGAGKGCENLVYVTWSTGIGAGLILNGRLYTGAHGTAGEIGHMMLAMNGDVCLCGQRGCVEMFACGNSLALREGRSAQEIFAAAREGDPLALAIVNRAATHVGMALVNLTNLIDPELIVVGGGITRSWGLVGPILRGCLSGSPYVKPYRRPRLVRARLGDSVGLVGATEWARLSVEMFKGG
jgi:glucokinase